MKSLPAAILTLCLCLPGAIWGQNKKSDSGWEVVQRHGRPYLDLEGIRQNYGFPDYKKGAKEFELRSPSALIQGAAGEARILINKLQYDLHFAPEVDGGRYYFSAFDLSNLLDQVLRPANYMRPTRLKTVYLQGVSGKWSTYPKPGSIIKVLEEALTQYNIEVKVMGEETEAQKGEMMDTTDLGDSIWIRLEGNGKLPHYHTRTSVLAPPGSPCRLVNGEPTAAYQAVYLGNLFDAQSIALATLIQSGLVFGPGAKGGKVMDAGVRQTDITPFQRSAGAAAHVEWGEEIDPDHLMKSIAAGVVRYANFMDGEVKRFNEEAAAQKSVMKIQGVDLEADEEKSNLILKIRLNKTELMEALPVADNVSVQAFLFAKEGANAVDLLEAAPPRIKWLTDLKNWTPEKPEELELLYHVEGASGGTLKGKTYGHVIRLVYDGKVQDTLAAPQGLYNQLWRFTAIFPK